MIRAGKITAAVLISILLFAAECITMGMFCVDRSLTEKSAERAAADSGIVREMLSTALTENTVNNGGRYGEIAEAAMETKAMMSFFGGYMTNAMRSAVYGSSYEEIADDELMKAFSSGIEELNNSGKFNITPFEEDFIKQQMQRRIPDLTADLNSIAGQLGMEQSSYDKYERFSRALAAGTARNAMLGVCAVLSAGLVLMFRRSKMGFVWCGGITLLASGMLLLIYSKAAEAACGGDEFVGFVSALAQNGVKSVAAAGFTAAAVFFILGAVLRKVCGRR